MLGDIRAEVGSALAMLTDQLDLITSAVELVAVLHDQLSAALAGSTNPDAALFLARIGEMRYGLAAALGEGSGALTVGSLLLENLR